MTPWGRNFLLLMRLTTENYWLIGGTHLRCRAAVGMDADIRFLEVEVKRKYTPLVTSISLINATIYTILVINKSRAFIIYLFCFFMTNERHRLP